MTDETLHQLSLDDREGRGWMMFVCSPKHKWLMFRSDLFLGIRGNRQIEVRFDGATADRFWALGNEQLITVDGDQPAGGAIAKMDGPALQRMIDDVVLFGQFHMPHERLRVRLIAFNGGTQDLDFNLKGLSGYLTNTFEPKCRPAKG